MTEETKTINPLIGKTPIQVEVDMEWYEIKFTFSDNSEVVFYHEQDCCESVVIEDITGDWIDLIGSPLLVAEQRSSSGDDGDYGTQTYTFYTFRGIGGSVDVRWFGQSNGYYSESVDMKTRKDVDSDWEYTFWYED